MPASYAVAYSLDSTEFIKVSIEEVVKKDIEEEILLVVCVMFVFL
nr:efflux RND transporter permease subunit [Sodalis-like endosymbiont of Proechinophthirus fluctus]